MIALNDVTQLLVPADCPESAICYPGGHPIPADFFTYVRGLIGASSEFGSSDFSVTWLDIVWRAYRMRTLDGVQYSYRRMRAVSSLKDCGIRAPIIEQLLSPRLNVGGLVIIAGAQGNGKSTTCAALVVDRLQRHGGLCVTVEDPVEIKMQGRHGNGMCLQRQLDEHDSFASAVRGSLRAYPPESNSMMMIGEVRDSETAALALRSAVDGRLVVISLHASGIVASLQRIVSLAAGTVGEPEARALLAHGLRCVVYQKLVIKKLRIHVLFDTDSVAGKILNLKGSLEMIKSDIELQHNQITNHKPLGLRTS